MFRRKQRYYVWPPTKEQEDRFCSPTRRNPWDMIDLLLERNDSLADRAQHHFEAERRETDRLRAQLEQQERLYLTEIFARRGDGDPYAGLGTGRPLRLPSDWEVLYEREEIAGTCEVEHLFKITSPSGSLWCSRIRLTNVVEKDSRLLDYHLHRQRIAVYEQAIDHDYAIELQGRRALD